MKCLSLLCKFILTGILSEHSHYEPLLDWHKFGYLLFYCLLIMLPYNTIWMVCLMLFHIASFLLIISTQNYYKIQYALFFFFLVLVSLSEKINEIAAQHWKLFSHENFFDSGGLFISTVFSLPLLINCLLLIVIWLKFSFKALVLIKSKKLSTNRKQDPTKDDNRAQELESETKKKK
ncbi:transmembrane protein 18 isoform X2 [Hydra vulgaris]|uniref:transmembrane protein 18 isoform X2 n=1 Tax=Hydra vulgaris TaxID=6087 RepID=UPI001F5F2C7C|nr:transmembrane protein 18 isoform X2 [Hydra vulgaris]